MVCFAPQQDGKPLGDGGLESLSGTGYFRQILKEIDLSHIDHAREVTQDLRHRINLNSILDRVITSEPRIEVSQLLNLAMGISGNRNLPLDLRKELLGVFVDAAAVCANAARKDPAYIEPQIRLGRILHAVSATTSEVELAAMLKSAIAEHQILFDPTLLQYTPDQFEHEIKYREHEGDFRGFTQDPSFLEYVDSIVSIGIDGQNLVETNALFSTSRLPDARHLSGYAISITSPDGAATTVSISTKDREFIKGVHKRAVEIDRSSGKGAAIAYLEQVAELKKVA